MRVHTHELRLEETEYVKTTYYGDLDAPEHGFNIVEKSIIMIKCKDYKKESPGIAAEFYKSFTIMSSENPEKIK
jgi:hypothetical protein